LFFHFVKQTALALLTMPNPRLTSRNTDACMEPHVFSHIFWILKTARYPGIAKRFRAYAASEAGRAIFRMHGLYHEE
jgi:hypothetical protein